MNAKDTFAMFTHSEIIKRIPRAPEITDFDIIASDSLCFAKWVSLRSQAIQNGILYK